MTDKNRIPYNNEELTDWCQQLQERIQALEAIVDRLSQQEIRND